METCVPPERFLIVTILLKSAYDVNLAYPLRFLTYPKLETAEVEKKRTIRNNKNCLIRVYLFRTKRLTSKVGNLWLKLRFAHNPIEKTTCQVVSPSLSFTSFLHFAALYFILYIYFIKKVFFLLPSDVVGPIMGVVLVSRDPFSMLEEKQTERCFGSEGLDTTTEDWWMLLEEMRMRKDKRRRRKNWTESTLRLLHY